MESTSVTLAILSDLLKINRDRAECYKRASNDTDDHGLKALFCTMVDQSQQNIADITKEIIQHNGNAEPVRTYAGKIYGAWETLKTQFIDNSIKNVLTSCESREAAAVHIYRQARKKTLGAQIAGLIERQALSLKSSHEVIRVYLQAYIKVDKLYS